MLAADDELVITLAACVRSGDVDALAALLAAHPVLATARIGDDAASRTALHIATDWPGHYPDVARTIAVLVAAGAPVDGRFAGPHRETPLHWAASSDDIAAIDALFDAGADIEAPGAVHTDGTPLSDAVIFGQWRAARRLVERGAAMTLWQAAALGEATVLARLVETTPCTDDELTNACWHACRAGQPATARTLVGLGADIDWVGHDGLTPRRAGIESGSDELVAWLQTV